MAFFGALEGPRLNDRGDATEISKKPRPRPRSRAGEPRAAYAIYEALSRKRLDPSRKLVNPQKKNFRTEPHTRCSRHILRLQGATAHIPKRQRRARLTGALRSSARPGQLPVPYLSCKGASVYPDR